LLTPFLNGVKKINVSYKNYQELRYAIYLEYFNRTFFMHQVSFWKQLNKRSVKKISLKLGI